MIISASRRTDIPAFYSEWFLNRLAHGFLLVANPMNRRQVARVSLDPALIDCIVFWTKNPAPLTAKLAQLADYHFYFQFTLTPYPRRIEQRVPETGQAMDAFRRLAEAIGPERVIWRYDPILISEEFSADYHARRFEDIARGLATSTKKCMISFLRDYKKCARNMGGIAYRIPGKREKTALARRLAAIAGRHGIRMETCAEEADFSQAGIGNGKCIDDELIARITGAQGRTKKDPNQRSACRCAASIDIGAYNSCPHRCLYCYANFDHDRAAANCRNHDPASELLTDRLLGDERITEKKMARLFAAPASRASQLRLF